MFSVGLDVVWFGVTWIVWDVSFGRVGAVAIGSLLDETSLWIGWGAEVQELHAQSACQARPLGRPPHFICMDVWHELHHTPHLPRFRNKLNNYYLATFRGGTFDLIEVNKIYR